MKECDVVVVGGGAAGLSVALVLVRARRMVVVVDAGVPRNAPAANMHGFLSRDGMPPRELLAAGRAEVSSHGGHLIDDTVVGVEPGSRCGWSTAHTCASNPGKAAIADDARGSAAMSGGRGIRHCRGCHGYEVRDQPLGVLGGAPEAVQHALLIRQWSPDLILFPHTDAVGPEQREHLAARGIRIVDGTIGRLVVNNDQLQGVELDGGTVVPRAAVFVRPRFVANADLLTGLGCEVDAHGWVVHDPVGRTSVAGVWVAGNAADPRAQVISAAGEGSAAAIALNADLVDEDVKRALTDHRAGQAASAPVLPTSSF